MSYLPIRVSTLRGDQPIEFDAYVKINDKYILYLRRGDSFEGTRLTRLKEKNLKKMFIVESDEKNYRHYLDHNISHAFDKTSPKTLQNRVEIAQGATQTAAEEVMENPEDSAAYSAAKDGALRFVEFLQREDEGFLHILNMENIDNSVAHHGVTVSSLSVALAARLGINDSKQLQLLSLGALLHDFEHFHSSINIARPITHLNPQEMVVYKEHPLLGARRLQDKRHFDQAVLNIISQHEEYIDGKGFPMGLNQSKTDPLALIVASANKVDRLMTFEKVPRDELARKLLIRYTGCHPLEHLKNLGEILNQFKP
jgi:putative nucleotidyltransferase with HDIG domain